MKDCGRVRIVRNVLHVKWSAACEVNLPTAPTHPSISPASSFLASNTQVTQLQLVSPQASEVTVPESRHVKNVESTGLLVWILTLEPLQWLAAVTGCGTCLYPSMLHPAEFTGMRMLFLRKSIVFHHGNFELLSSSSPAGSALGSCSTWIPWA